MNRFVTPVIKNNNNKNLIPDLIPHPCPLIIPFIELPHFFLKIFVANRDGHVGTLESTLDSFYYAGYLKRTVIYSARIYCTALYVTLFSIPVMLQERSGTCLCTCSGALTHIHWQHMWMDFFRVQKAASAEVRSSCQSEVSDCSGGFFSTRVMHHWNYICCPPLMCSPEIYWGFYESDDQSSWVINRYI